MDRSAAQPLLVRDAQLHRCYGNRCDVVFTVLIRNAARRHALAALPHGVAATGTEPATDPQVDPAPCVAAVAANDDDKIIAVCGALIDNEKTVKADRIKALIARAGAYDAQGQIDRAIADYDTVLRLDPTLADIFNARGELWRKKGDRPQRAGRFRRRDQAQPGSAGGAAPITNRWRWNWSGSAR